MSLKKKLDSDEHRSYWEYVELSSREVNETYPDWKRGGERNFTRAFEKEKKDNNEPDQSIKGNGYHSP